MTLIVAVIVLCLVGLCLMLVITLYGGDLGRAEDELPPKPDPDDWGGVGGF
jgi:hypothetical protein